MNRQPLKPSLANHARRIFGTLVVSLMDGFTAALGSQFEIVDVAGMLSGDGSDVTLPAVPEPTGVALLAAIGLFLSAVRCRR
jgi:hypothetical protein